MSPEGSKPKRTRRSSQWRESSGNSQPTTTTLAPKETKAAKPSPKKQARKRRERENVPNDCATVVSIDASQSQPTPPVSKKSKSQQLKPAATTAEDDNFEAPRVSICPDFAAEAQPLPNFEGTALERLEACLAALNPSNQADQPTMMAIDKNSSFATNIGKVSEFVQAALSSECLQGGEEDEPAALYVCGAPGIGKTSGVTLCCEQAVSSWDEDDGPKPKFCAMNASEMSWQATLKVLWSALGLRSGCTEKKVADKLKTTKSPILLVVDEIDSLVSSGSGKLWWPRKALAVGKRR